MVRKGDETSIPLKKSTRERLGEFGNKNESWDRLLNRLMDQMKQTEKENHVMRELREAIIPIPREVLNSTPEEIDSLDLSVLELENRVKMCWKRFAKNESQF